jgi:gluconolactonase
MLWPRGIIGDCWHSSTADYTICKDQSVLQIHDVVLACAQMWRVCRQTERGWEMSLTIHARGLAFPEGPIALADGRVLFVEMSGPALSCLHPDGRYERVCHIPGGPNGAAMAPDGRIAICNNGAAFTCTQHGEQWDVAYADPADYVGGSIQLVDPTTCQITTLHTSCDGIALSAPNDLVFDRHGGLYFTDLGYAHDAQRRPGIYYITPDGAHITCVVTADSPNGIGLSPDGQTLYWNETPTARVMAARLAAAGEITGTPQCLYQFSDCMLDSLAIDSAGNVCVAVLGAGAIGVVSPSGELVDYYPTGCSGTTNICFGGADGCTAYITLGGCGQLVSMRWPRPGLPLAW